MIQAFTTHNANYSQLAELTNRNKQDYCTRHGYGFKSSLYDGHVPILWARIRKMLELLPSCEWLWATDTDSIVTNPAIRIEDVVTDADLLVCSDYNGLNNGLMLLRNTDWTIKFLGKWWESRKRFGHYACADQTALAYLLYLEQREKWAVLPQRVANSYMYDELYDYGAYAEGQWQPGDWMLHLPAVQNEKRMGIIRSCIANFSLCTFS